MDDYSVSSLNESRNEFCARFLNMLTPKIVVGLRSIFNEAWDLCVKNEQSEKYLMTFQTFLSRVPKWNSTIIGAESKRVRDAVREIDACSSLEDLLTCVHIIQLKALSCVRVGKQAKKIDIDIPSFDAFLHKVYIHVARKVYTNVYLFEVNLEPLQTQKYNFILEKIIKECVLNSIRESVPVDNILRAYLDETVEQDVEIVEEILNVEPSTAPAVDTATATAPAVDIANNPAVDTTTASGATSADSVTASVDSDSAVNVRTAESTSTTAAVKFSDIDKAVDIAGQTSDILAPKTLERLQKISDDNALKLKLEQEEDEDSERISIGGDVALDFADIKDLSKSLNLNERSNLVLDVEVLQ